MEGTGGRNEFNVRHREPGVPSRTAIGLTPQKSEGEELVLTAEPGARKVDSEF